MSIVTDFMDSSVYTYNKGGQRAQVIRNAENYANYTYDKIGQVTGDQAYVRRRGQTVHLLCCVLAATDFCVREWVNCNVWL